MSTRILIYGGTNLSADLIRFVRRLSRKFLTFPDVVLLSGGFDHFKRYPGRTSVDLAVLKEAKSHLDERQLARRFETWIPAKKRADDRDSGLDRRTVERFGEGDVHELSGTAQARRFALVNSADALVTIGGEGNTTTVLELALALNKPALPVAFSGGDSLRIWKRNRDDFLRGMRIPAHSVRRLEAGSRSARELNSLASDVAIAVHEAAEKRCLVLMPFGPGHDGFHTKVVEPAIRAAGYIPNRIDKSEYAGNIPVLFRASLDRARAVVVDVTGFNPNVLYELGHVHARGFEPFLILRRRVRAGSSAGLPFYLLHERLMEAEDTDAGHQLVERDLTEWLTGLLKRSDAGRLAR